MTPTTEAPVVPPFCAHCGTSHEPHTAPLCPACPCEACKTIDWNHIVSVEPRLGGAALALIQANVDANTEALHQEITRLKQSLDDWKDNLIQQEKRSEELMRERDEARAQVSQWMEQFDAAQAHIGRTRAEANELKAKLLDAEALATAYKLDEQQTAAAAAHALTLLDDTDEAPPQVREAMRLLSMDPGTKRHLATAASLQQDMEVLVKRCTAAEAQAQERLKMLKELGTTAGQRQAVARYNEALAKNRQLLEQVKHLQGDVRWLHERIQLVREACASAVMAAPGFVWKRAALARRMCVVDVPEVARAAEGANVEEDSSEG